MMWHSVGHMMGNPTMIPCESGDTLIPTIEAFDRNRALIAALLTLPRDLINTYHREFMQMMIGQTAMHQTQGTEDGASLLETLAIESDIINQILLLQTPVFEAASRGLYAASIVFAWTMFETLTKDAFIAIQQARPDLNLPNVGDKDADGNRILNFTGLDKMRKSYRCFEGSQSLNAKVWRNRDLRGLVTTRNQLVHSGGVITDDYRRLVNETDLKIGDLLHLDYPLVRRFVEGAIEGGRVLLAFLDTWLISNPAPILPSSE